MISRPTRLRALVLALLALSGCAREKAVPPAPAARAAPVAVSAAKFADITVSAGLDFKQASGSCGKPYFVETVAAGAALFDANNDGNLDIYFPQPKPLAGCKFPEPLHHRLYIGDGRGHFREKMDAFGGVDTTGYGIGAAVGDYDNDGDADLFVACEGGSRLFRNRGDGRFEDVTGASGAGPKGFAVGGVWLDYDGDGDLDLYVCRYSEWTMGTDIRCPGPNGESDVCPPVSYPPALSVLYKNNGDGTFTDVTKQAGVGGVKRRSLGATAADFDGDGRLDLFVANDMGPNFLYHNNGNGTFEDVAMPQNVAYGLMGQSQANMGVAVGDYDGDGDLDVLVTTFSTEPYTLYRNDGVTFTDVSAEAGIAQPTLPLLGFGTGFFDAANAGRLDLFFANGHVSQTAHFQDRSQTYKQRNQLLLSDGAGRFTESRDALPPDDVRVHRAACFGDVDNDGRVDILVTATNDRPTLLHNESPAGNWLLVRLTNARGCVTPIGARCIATVGGRKLQRVMLGGGSYGGDSDSRVHFGLGAADRVERLEIHWLSGKTQTLTDIPANRILAVRER